MKKQSGALLPDPIDKSKLTPDFKNNTDKKQDANTVNIVKKKSDKHKKHKVKNPHSQIMKNQFNTDLNYPVIRGQNKSSIINLTLHLTALG